MQLSLSAPGQSARACASVFAIAPSHDSVNEREVVPIRILQISRAAGRKVVDHVRPEQTQAVEINDVQIRALTRFERAAITEAKQARCIVSLLLDHHFDR